MSHKKQKPCWFHSHSVTIILCSPFWKPWFWLQRSLSTNGAWASFFGHSQAQQRFVAETRLSQIQLLVCYGRPRWDSSSAFQDIGVPARRAAKGLKGSTCACAGNELPGICIDSLSKFNGFKKNCQKIIQHDRRFLESSVGVFKCTRVSHRNRAVS